MKRIAILCVAALSLASCTTTGVDSTIQRSLPQVCSALQTAYVGFSAVAEATGKVRKSTVDKVNAAYAGVRTLCVDPANATAINAAILVGQAYLVVTAALKEARAAQ